MPPGFANTVDSSTFLCKFLKDTLGEIFKFDTKMNGLVFGGERSNSSVHKSHRTQTN